MKVYEVTIKGHVTLPDSSPDQEQTVEEMTEQLLETAYPRSNGYAICRIRAEGSKLTATLHISDIQFGESKVLT